MPVEPSAEILARRARKAARRDKQRGWNVLRAEKMHAVRVAQAAREKIAPKIKNIKTQQYFIGCSGWYYWHWQGAFYAADLPRSQWFDHYADNFQTVELNAPFYSWPTLATVNTWVKQAAGKTFIYTVKVCELITHIKKFARTQELVKDFGLIADLLGERMGCFLFQLPPSYHYTPARLKVIVSQLDPQLRNVVEFRHKSWWNDNVYKKFRDAGIIFCSCSGPRLPNELVITTDDIYVRFHGTTQWYRHDYTIDELKIWAARIKASGAKRAWVYFNNDRDGYAIKNARQLLKLLKK